jgi:hypothetical protein
MKRIKIERRPHTLRIVIRLPRWLWRKPPNNKDELRHELLGKQRADYRKPAGPPT